MDAAPRACPVPRASRRPRRRHGEPGAHTSERLAAPHHRARTAMRHPAAEPWPAKSQVVGKHEQQRSIWIDADRAVGTVDAKPDRDLTTVAALRRPARLPGPHAPHLPVVSRGHRTHDAPPGRTGHQHVQVAHFCEHANELQEPVWHLVSVRPTGDDPVGPEAGVYRMVATGRMSRITLNEISTSTGLTATACSSMRRGFLSDSRSSSRIRTGSGAWATPRLERSRRERDGDDVGEQEGRRQDPFRIREVPRGVPPSLVDAAQCDRRSKSALGVRLITS